MYVLHTSAISRQLTIALSIHTVTEPLYTFREIKSLLGSLLPSRPLLIYDSSFSFFRNTTILWINLRRPRLQTRSPSYKQRFDAKLSYFNSKPISSLSKATSSFSYELALLRMRNRNPPFYIPKNSMAKSTSLIPGSPQSRPSYESITRLLAMPLLSSTTSIWISNLTFKPWFFLSFPRLKTIKPGPISRFSTNSLAFTRIRIRCRKQRTSYTLSSKVLIRFMRLLLSLNVFYTKHMDKTGTTLIRLQPSVKDSIL
jgi:hypothetical protein